MEMDYSSCPWDYNTCRNAVFGGHVDVLRYAVENRCPCPRSIGEDAVFGGNIDCVKWITENYLSDKSCFPCIVAIIHKKDEILEYLIEHAYQINERVVNVACNHGNLAALKLLRGKGLLPTEDCIDMARKMKQTYILDWLKSIGLL